MTEKDMKYFFTEAKYVSWEDYKHCTSFQPADSFDTCCNKLFTVLRCFNHHERQAWNFFEACYDDLPIQHRIPLMLTVLYQDYNVNYNRMVGRISDYIFAETPKLKEQRLARNQEFLGKYFNADGNITLYRGIAEGSLLPECAISYTVDKAVAEFFIEHHMARHGSRFGGVYSRTVNIEDILYYSNERKEQEVFIIPDELCDLAYGDENDLGLWTLGFTACRELFPAEYAKFAAEHDIKREVELMMAT